MLNNTLKLTKPSIEILQIGFATLGKLHWRRVLDCRPGFGIRRTGELVALAPSGPEHSDGGAYEGGGA